MPITRSSAQKSQTLEEFYHDLAQHNPLHFSNVKDDMLAFIDMVNTTFVETQLWGLTSHERLGILSEDNWQESWRLLVSSIGTGTYYFEYLLPIDKQPWDHAMVKGGALSLDEAKRYLLIAMRESEGWKGNEELERLLRENNL